MKTLKYILTIFFSISVFAKGGAVVGNGAGLTENNVQYAFVMLPHLLSNCIEKLTCHQNGEDKDALEKIRRVAEKNLEKAPGSAIQFVSGQPDFFITGTNEPNRVAKTCLSADCAVYFNLDVLHPELTYPQLASLLVHEFGHQAGIENHSYLDMLGAKIRALAEARYTAYVYPFDFNRIEVRQLNSDFPRKYSELHFVYNGVSTRLTDEVYSVVSRLQGFTGYELFNGHYIFEVTAPETAFEIVAKVFVSRAGSTAIDTQLVKFRLEAGVKGDNLRFFEKKN